MILVVDSSLPTLLVPRLAGLNVTDCERNSGQGEECGEQIAVASVSQGPAAVAAEPGGRALDDPALAPESFR
jgi:hypothetical protein